MSEVTWTITSIDEQTGDVIVNFTNGIKENVVCYKWPGDKDSLIYRLNQDAYTYAHLWKDLSIPSGIKTELFGLTGTASAANSVNLDGNNFAVLDPQVV